MRNSESTSYEIDSLVLKYADESFSLSDAIRFEVLVKQDPDLALKAQANREIANRLGSLPRITARDGFTDRLMLQLEK